MSMNWPPTHPGLLGWSNAQLVSDSNTDNASLNPQHTAAIAPCFTPVSRGIPSPQGRSDGDFSARDRPAATCKHASSWRLDKTSMGERSAGVPEVLPVSPQRML